MPTCSQAKIITNLETDIQKRFFALSRGGPQPQNGENSSSSSQQQQQQNNNDNENNFYDALQSLNLNNNEKDNFKTTYQTLHRSYANSNNKTSPRNLNNRKLAALKTNSKQNHQVNDHQNSKSSSRRISLDNELTGLSNCLIQNDQAPSSSSSQILHKIPITFDNFSFTTNNSTITNNNSQFILNKNEQRQQHQQYHTSLYRNGGQMRNNFTIKGINTKNNFGGSDGEDVLSDEQLSGRSADQDQDQDSPRQVLNNTVRQQQNPAQLMLHPRRSIDFTSILPLARSTKRNSFDYDIISNKKENLQSETRRNSLGTTLPSLTTSSSQFNNPTTSMSQLVRQQQQQQTEDESNEPDLERRQISLNQAKRLLALASIRPSKTFHKTMTQEEIDVLRKYYDIIKPKVTTNNNNNLTDQVSAQTLAQIELEKGYASQAPNVYDTTKVNMLSLHNLKQFIDKYKQDIEAGLYVIDYDSLSDPKGFILKPQDNEQQQMTIKFPNELNDTFFALAAVTAATTQPTTTTTRESSSWSIGSNSLSSVEKECSIRLGEANLFRIVNWNDTTSSQTANVVVKSKSKSKLSPFAFASSSSSSNSSPTSSTLSFDYIKNMSSLVSSILEPKLLTKLSYTGVDISVLPGGANYDIPTFEELGIDLNSILSSNSNNISTLADPTALLAQQQQQHQSSKLKASAYKKLKDKVNTSKCMWFAQIPERKPLAVIFETATATAHDISHEQLLEQTNQYLKEGHGHVESLQFVPRSVHFGSVYVDNLWILTLTDMNTKFFTITNGLRINVNDKEEKISVKSYDEFIFSEYERFIRNEKYKKLIKNHEKAVQQQQQINSNSNTTTTHRKKSITSS